MNGVVFDIKRGCVKDGPGLRTSVFMKGCPLKCVWCHNPESQSPAIQRAVATDEVCGREMSVEEVMGEVRRDKVFYSASGGGATFTGGEPTMQFDFLMALCGAAKAEGIHVAVDTCGFAPRECFAALLPCVDLFLYDLKCMDAARHLEFTGVPNGQIIENLEFLDSAGAKFWIRCPLVPGLNDSDADLAALRDFTRGLRNMEKLEICPYHPLGLEKCAKFGLSPRYSGTAQPSAADLARYNAFLRPREGCAPARPQAMNAPEGRTATGKECYAI